MTRDHLINFSEWNFLDHAGSNKYINFQDRFFPPKARAKLGIRSLGSQAKGRGGNKSLV